MQCRRRLEYNLDLTVCLPSLFANEVLKVTRERLHSQVPIRRQGLVIGVADGDDVLVRGQRVATIKLLDAVGGLLLEGSFDFLGDDATTEDAGERVADCCLQLSLEALGDTHDDPLSGPACRGCRSR